MVIEQAKALLPKKFPLQPVSDTDLAGQVVRNGVARKIGWSTLALGSSIIGFSALPGGVTLPLGLAIGGGLIALGRFNEYLSNRKTVHAAEGNESYLASKVKNAHRLRVAKTITGIATPVIGIPALAPGGAPGALILFGGTVAYGGLRLAEASQNMAAAHEAREILGVNQRRRSKAAQPKKS